MNVGYKADLDAETTGITDFHRPAEPLNAPLDLVHASPNLLRMVYVSLMEIAHSVSLLQVLSILL